MVDSSMHSDLHNRFRRFIHTAEQIRFLLECWRQYLRNVQSRGGRHEMNGKDEESRGKESSTIMAVCILAAVFLLGLSFSPIIAIVLIATFVIMIAMRAWIFRRRAQEPSDKREHLQGPIPNPNVHPQLLSDVGWIFVPFHLSDVLRGIQMWMENMAEYFMLPAESDSEARNFWRDWSEIDLIPWSPLGILRRALQVQTTDI